MEASYVFSVNRELFDENCDPSPRYLVNQGGTSSGKTYCIMQRMVELAVQNYRSIITVAGQDLPNLKVGAMRDTEAIITGDPWLSAFFTRNHSESFYRGLNGSLIEFKSYKDAQDAKNGKRDYLFVNEANGLTWEVFWQLAIRTRRQIWVDYNPSARFWVHDQLIGRPDCKLIISDHRGNGFLSEAEHAKIEGIKDPHLFAVYARGLTGRVTGLVLQNWDIVDELPPAEECKIKPLFGLDFGYTNDPTALEEIRLAHGEIWVDEYIYQTGLVNVDPSHRDPNIVDIMRQRGITRDRLIVADSAEEKSIREISNEGFWIIPATKGAGSVRNGIDIMRRYKIHFTRRSVGAIEEAKKWKWAVDRNGNVTNEAIDRYNHAMDAIRYASQEKFGARHTGTARARINKL